jgi:hypothetical protein
MNNRSAFIYFLALLKFALPFLLQSPVYEPHRDELLYLAEGNHPAWGFMEVPPLLSGFAWISNHIAHTLFWIKCWSALFGALNFLVVAGIIRELGGKNFALLLGFLPFVLGPYLRINYLFQPVSLEIFFWTALASSLLMWTRSGRNKWLYLFGVSAGLAMLSKYSAAFYIASLLAGLLLTPYRSIFSNKHFYIASLVGFLIFLPNLVWQYIHHFPVLFHMRELRETQLQYVNPISFLTDQLLMNIAVLPVWITGLFWAAFTRSGKSFRFLGWASFFIIFLLLVLHGKNYYTLGAYPILFALGACRLEKLTARPVWLRFPLLLYAAALSIFLIPIYLPIFAPARLAAFFARNHIAKTGALTWEDQKTHPLPQDFSDMLGWKEMAGKTARVYHALTATEKKQTVVYADNYGEAGALNYYGSDYQLPAAFSDNASFLYWMPAVPEYENLLLVTPDKQEMQHPFIHQFVSATVEDSIQNPFARERGTLIILLRGADSSFKVYFRERLRKKKAAL